MKNFREHNESQNVKVNTKKLLIILNIVALLVYVVLQIVITASTGNMSREIDFIRREKARLRRENEFLKSEIQKENSLVYALPLVEKYKLEKQIPIVIEVYDHDIFSMNNTSQ